VDGPIAACILLLRKNSGCCQLGNSCKRTTKCKCVDFCINSCVNLGYCINSWVNLGYCSYPRFPAATSSYLRLPTATCSYLRPRQLLFLLLTRPNIEIALQNACLCLKNLLMSGAISITRYSNQVYCYCCQLLCSSDASLVRCFAGQMLPWLDVSLVIVNEE
jgi:hypothetical protein